MTGDSWFKEPSPFMITFTAKKDPRHVGLQLAREICVDGDQISPLGIKCGEASRVNRVQKDTKIFDTSVGVPTDPYLVILNCGVSFAPSVVSSGGVARRFIDSTHMADSRNDGNQMSKVEGLLHTLMDSTGKCISIFAFPEELLSQGCQSSCLDKPEGAISRECPRLGRCNIYWWHSWCASIGAERTAQCFPTGVPLGSVWGQGAHIARRAGVGGWSLEFARPCGIRYSGWLCAGGTYNHKASWPGRCMTDQP
ncbi:hypothetical protein GQ457_12G014060 [Hibiscus cannabinus]